MNMSERIQDQRPVYMGTFSKYIKTFENRIAYLENDIEDLAKKTRIYSRKIDEVNRLSKILFGSVVFITVAELAILMLQFLK
jgi:hypothetical protein